MADQLGILVLLQTEQHELEERGDVLRQRAEQGVHRTEIKSGGDAREKETKKKKTEAYRHRMQRLARIAKEGIRDTGMQGAWSDAALKGAFHLLKNHFFHASKLIQPVHNRLQSHTIILAR